MLFSTSITLLALASQMAAAPIGQPSPDSMSTAKRQSITTPVGVNITDLNLGDISPIEDGFLELDSDSGGETENGGTAVSVANGYLGSVGTGQSAQNPNGVEGSSAACRCASSAAAANNQTTSSSSSSSGLVNGGVINGGVINAPLVSLKNIKRYVTSIFA